MDLTCSLQRKDGPPNPPKWRGSVLSPRTHRRDPLTDLATDLLRHVANFSEKPGFKEMSPSASRIVADTASALHAPSDANNAAGVDRPHVLSTTSSSLVSSGLPADDRNAGKGLQSEDKQSTTSAIANDNGNALSARNAKKSLNRIFGRKSEPYFLVY